MFVKFLSKDLPSVVKQKNNVAIITKILRFYQDCIFAMITVLCPKLSVIRVCKQNNFTTTKSKRALSKTNFILYHSIKHIM